VVALTPNPSPVDFVARGVHMLAQIDMVALTPNPSPVDFVYR